MSIEIDIKEKEIVDFKKRRYVRQMVDLAIKKGIMSRADKCDHCSGNEKGIDAHHVDYGKPYDVLWLCKKCHGLVHRKDHPLNPENNLQTPLPSVCENYEMVTLTFSIPVRNFLAIKRKSQETGKNISSIIREAVINKFKTKSNQLEFNFNDQPQNEQNAGIRDMAENKILLHRPECSHIQEIWSEGNKSLPGMDERLFSIS